MNVKLLRKIQKHILAEPKRYDQNRWRLTPTEIAALGDSAPPCGTVACIAGWACALTESNPCYEIDIPGIAMKALKLRNNQRLKLFAAITDGRTDGKRWPDKFIRLYKKARSPLGRARAAVARIDHFIKTKGAE